MSSLKRSIVKTPILGRSVLFLHRAIAGFGYFRRPIWVLFKWLFTSRETGNFTYDLHETNKRYLASLIADITDKPVAVIAGYIREVDDDVALRTHIANATLRSDWASMADREVRFGRRIGWYALARVLKPKIIVETGVDKGMGACLLTAALMRNQAEGFEGRYFGTDINPEAGYLLSGDYANYGTLLFGDSIDSLKRFDGVIDLFINDSDHSASYESEEYKTIADKLSPHAVVLGDNAHVTDKLFEFSQEANRQFVFFPEKPKDHWYPGAGIGISFRR